MRISDCSSDVCSSDLGGESTIWTVIDSDRDQWRHRYSRVTPGARAGIVEVAISPEGEMSRINVSYDMTALPNSGDEALMPYNEDNFRAMLDEWQRLIGQWLQTRARSEERRVGKECVSTWRSRW